jgi:O-antigen ligase
MTIPVEGLAASPLPASWSDPARAAAAPGPLERLFLHIGLIILQGAFLTMPRLIQSGGQLDETAGSDPVNQLCYGLLLLGILVLMARHLRLTGQALRSNAIFFLLPALVLCSTVWSIDPALTFKRSVWMAGTCAFDLYLVMRLSLDEIMAAISRTIILTLLASVVAAIALPGIGTELGRGLNGEWRGVFAQKNQLGHVMATGAVVQLLVMLRAGRIKLGALALFAACAALIKLSGSVTSLFALCPAVALAGAYVCLRRGAPAVLITGLAASGGVCLLLGLIVWGGNGLAFLDRDGSFSGRTDLWPPVIEMIRLRPWLGWGFEAFWTPDNPYFDYVRQAAGWPAPNAHDGLLEVALDLGLTGVAALLAVLGWAAARAVRLLHRGEWLGIALLLVLVELVVANVTESFVLEATIFGWNFLVMLIFASGFALRRAAEAPSAPVAPILDRAKPCLAVID